MKTLQARVVKGRFVIDEPSPFPDGAIVELVIPDEDATDIGGRAYAALRRVLAQAEAEFQTGTRHTVEDLVRSRKVVGRLKR